MENDTAYLVASTETGRYCLVYSTSATGTTTAAGSTSRELTVTGHLASCPRASHRHKHEWQVNLTAYGSYPALLYTIYLYVNLRPCLTDLGTLSVSAQCAEVSAASTWSSSGSSLTTHALFVLGGLLSRYCLCR